VVAAGACAGLVVEAVDATGVTVAGGAFTLLGGAAATGAAATAGWRCSDGGFGSEGFAGCGFCANWFDMSKCARPCQSKMKSQILNLYTCVPVYAEIGGNRVIRR
jgi:hypothetical protein